MDLFTLFVLEDASSESSTSWADSIADKLVPNLGSFLTQLSALIVLIIVIIIFGHKPIRKMLDKRSNFIEESVNDAKSKNKEAEINLAQSKETLLASRKEADKIVNDASKEAKNEKERILDETREDVKRMKLQAEAEIEQAKVDAKEEVRQEMVDISLEASKELLKREVNSKDNQKLVDDFIKGIED